MAWNMPRNKEKQGTKSEALPQPRTEFWIRVWRWPVQGFFLLVLVTKGVNEVQSQENMNLSTSCHLATHCGQVTFEPQLSHCKMGRAVEVAYSYNASYWEAKEGG